MRDYKIGDLVIWIDKNYSDDWKEYRGVSLYGKVAKIIDIDKAFSLSYLLKFKEDIYSGWDGNKKGHYKWGRKNQIKLAINHLKFKKWIKG